MTDVPTETQVAASKKGCVAGQKDQVIFGCWMSASHEDCACGNICTPQEHDNLRFFDEKDHCVAALLSDRGEEKIIDFRCDNRRFWLSAHDCQVTTPTSQNLELEQQIRIFGADWLINCLED